VHLQRKVKCVCLAKIDFFLKKYAIGCIFKKNSYISLINDDYIRAFERLKLPKLKLTAVLRALKQEQNNRIGF
jgi:hypothetical protein